MVYFRACNVLQNEIDHKSLYVLHVESYNQAYIIYKLCTEDQLIWIPPKTFMFYSGAVQ